jgi:hypothetical protein
MPDEPRRMLPRMPTADRFVRTPKTPPQGIAVQLTVPEPCDDEVTGRYEGDELRAARKKRPTDERLERLEAKADDMVALKASVGVLNAKIDGVSGQISLLAGSVQQLAARDAVDYAARVQLDTARKVTVAEDDLDRRKTRRKAWLTVLGYAAGIAAGIHEILHLCGVL